MSEALLKGNQAPYLPNGMQVDMVSRLYTKRQARIMERMVGARDEIVLPVFLLGIYQ
jgi:hypothetical protein